MAPLGLAAAAVAGGLWLILPSPRMPISAGPVALAAAVLWVVLIGPDIVDGLAARTVPARGETFKIVQMNLWIQDWSHNEVKQAWIRKQNPDAVLLEEVGPAGGPLLVA